MRSGPLFGPGVRRPGSGRELKDCGQTVFLGRVHTGACMGRPACAEGGRREGAAEVPRKHRAGDGCGLDQSRMWGAALPACWTPQEGGKRGAGVAVRGKTGAGVEKTTATRTGAAPLRASAACGEREGRKNEGPDLPARPPAGHLRGGR